MTSTSSRTDLREIPGVGPRFVEAFEELGIGAVGDLVGQDPEALFEQLCEQRNEYVDRCVLYQFRSSVYYASEAKPEEALLLWWNRKDEALTARA
jgi:nucleotidyltransferase/DNA polymerase involved in DNA repair